MKSAFITGITGQDGSYLSELLLKKGYKVIGLVSKKHNIGYQNIKHIRQDLILEDGDLLDKDSLKKIIIKHKPAEIYNLGGITFVPTSWEKPVLTCDINTLGALRILEIIRDFLPKTKFYQATSAKIFGNPHQFPQNEKTAINPNTPYGVSKACAHFLTINFREHFKIFACSGILYNHESERRGPEFVTRKITQAAAKIKLGLQKELKLGDLQTRQDWGYAPDYVEAMWLMLQQKEPEDFVIATGKLYSVEDICQIAFSHLNLDWKKHVKQDTLLIRKEKTKTFVGDVSKAKKLLGWKPKITFSQMIIKMVKNDLELAKAT